MNPPLVLEPIYNEGAVRNRFFSDRNCQAVLIKIIASYTTLGFEHPWIGYIAVVNNIAVGACGFKYGVRNNITEIGYETFEPFRRSGFGTQMCKELLKIAEATNPLVNVTAQTRIENEISKKILEKNGFVRIKEIKEAGEPDYLLWKWCAK